MKTAAATILSLVLVLSLVPAAGAVHRLDHGPAVAVAIADPDPDPDPDGTASRAGQAAKESWNATLQPVWRDHAGPAAGGILQDRFEIYLRGASDNPGAWAVDTVLFGLEVDPGLRSGRPAVAARDGLAWITLTGRTEGPVDRGRSRLVQPRSTGMATVDPGDPSAGCERADDVETYVQGCRADGEPSVDLHLDDPLRGRASSPSPPETGSVPARAPASRRVAADPGPTEGSKTASSTGAEPAAPPVHPSRRLVGPLALAVTGLGVLAAVVLYRRLRREEVLDHHLRARMVAVVRREPAIHASELARRLDVAPTTILYHGRVLEETGHLVIRRSSGDVVYFVRGDGLGRIGRSLLCAVRTESKAAVVRTLMEEPGLSLSETARRIDRAPNTAKHHVDDLIEAGLVEDVAEGHRRRLRLTEAARDAVPTVLERGFGNNH